MLQEWRSSWQGRWNMDDEEDLSLEHDWECDKKCNTCEMRELCEKLEEKE